MNPQPPVLETGALPVELLPSVGRPCGDSPFETGHMSGAESYHRSSGARLARLLVERVATIEAAKLLHLDPLSVVRLVLRRDVVPALAILALQGHLHSLVIFCHERFLASCSVRMVG